MEQTHVGAKRAGLALGYFSIGLGLIEVAAPGRLARWLGVEGKAARNTIFAFGLRELLAGGALLRGPAVSTNVWNRVIGDVIDAGSLALAAGRSNRKGAVALAGGVVAGAFVADWLTARALDDQTGRTFPRTSRPDDMVSEGPRIAARSQKAQRPALLAKEPELEIEPHDLAAV